MFSRNIQASFKSSLFELDLEVEHEHTQDIFQVKYDEFLLSIPMTGYDWLQ